jgi:hypothetical protein
VIAPESPGRGRAEVWIDGVLAATIDTYRSTTTPRQVMFTRTFTTSGTHTIRMVVLGTSGRARVDLDAFLVLH